MPTTIPYMVAVSNKKGKQMCEKKNLFKKKYLI